MTQDQDKVLEYYIRRIGSVGKEFPQLTSPELDSAIQNAVDEWTDDAEERISDEGSFDRFLRPDGNGHESLMRMIERLESMGSDASAFRVRVASDGEDPGLADELMEAIRKLEDERDRRTEAYLSSTSDGTSAMLRKWFSEMSSLDRTTRRCLWSLRPSDFKRGMLSDFKSYSKVFRNDPEVRRFTDILGRKGQYALSMGEIMSFVGDSRAQGIGSEIKGVELGRDVSNLVPSELSSMMDDDLSILFDLKYVEGRLMCFSREDEVETERDDSGQVPSSDNLGPIILICDSSGSMYGTRLFLSKALCFTLISRASLQNRRILRIDFNAKSRHVDISPDNHIRELHKFLTMRAGGGTEPGPAIREAVELIKDKRYCLADIVVISDFELDMSNFRRGNRLMTELRGLGCRIHSVFIPAKNAKNRGDFDSCWEIKGGRRRTSARGRFKELT